MGWGDGVGMRCYQFLLPWINRGQNSGVKKKKKIKSVSCVFRSWKTSKHFFFQISSDLKPWKFRNYFTHGGWGNKRGRIFFLFFLKMNCFLVGSLWRKSWLTALLVTTLPRCCLSGHRDLGLPASQAGRSCLEKNTISISSWKTQWLILEDTLLLWPFSASSFRFLIEAKGKCIWAAFLFR